MCDFTQEAHKPLRLGIRSSWFCIFSDLHTMIWMWVMYTFIVFITENVILGYISCVIYVYYCLCINVTNMYVVGIHVTCTCGHFVTCAFNCVSAMLYVYVSWHMYIMCMACVCDMLYMSLYMCLSRVIVYV